VIQDFESQILESWMAFLKNLAILIEKDKLSSSVICFLEILLQDKALASKQLISAITQQIEQ